jgi:lipopolysaccharide/colanic/teichoic acid biosynthesis glycosyltransferase
LALDSKLIGSDDSKTVSVVALTGTDQLLISPIKWQGYFTIKRLLDIFISGALLLVLFPLFFLISLIIFVSSPGPVLYKGSRYGKDGKPFQFLKFRSMYVDADKRQLEMEKTCNESNGAIFKMKNDPRIIPCGKFIRKYSIDELPQLLNVFVGDMSLVGPRPLPVHQGDKLVGIEKSRMTVPQGMTCFWQVMGRSDLSFEEMVRLDIEYVQKIGFRTDARILIRTPIAVITGRGAY